MEEELVYIIEKNIQKKHTMNSIKIKISLWFMVGLLNFCFSQDEQIYLSKIEFWSLIIVSICPQLQI